MSLYSESITWSTVDEKLPPLEQTVLLSMAENPDDPVWLGWWTGEEWHFIDGMIADQETHKVVAWAVMPQGVM